MIIDSKTLEELAQRLASAVPPGLSAVKSDIEKSFQAVLASALAGMNLVTREEFDVQREVLARTRQKLEALEVRVAELEAQVNPRP